MILWTARLASDAAVLRYTEMKLCISHEKQLMEFTNGFTSSERTFHMVTYLSSYTTTAFASGKENSRTNFLSSKGNANKCTHTNTLGNFPQRTVLIYMKSQLFVHINSGLCYYNSTTRVATKPLLIWVTSFTWKTASNVLAGQYIDGVLQKTRSNPSDLSFC